MSAGRGVEWDATHIRCRSATHRAADNPLRAHGRLGAACGVEYAAQAMAVHGALVAASAPLASTVATSVRGTMGAALGFLASVRNVVLSCHSSMTSNGPHRECATHHRGWAHVCTSSRCARGGTAAERPCQHRVRDGMRQTAERALVTGGSGAIGAAICRRLAGAGHYVYVHSHRGGATAQALVSEIDGERRSGERCTFDITDAAATRAALETVLRAGPIQILVNNAGVHDDAVLPGMTAGAMAPRHRRLGRTASSTSRSRCCCR